MAVYLTASEVEGFNASFVGPGQLRDFSLLEAAILRPQATAFGEDAYRSTHEKAAALLHSLARNHPFVDGNKRTALAATAVFYRLNGYRLASPEPGEEVGLVVDAAQGFVDVAAIAGKLKEWAINEIVDFDGDEAVPEASPPIA